MTKKMKAKIFAAISILMAFLSTTVEYAYSKFYHVTSLKQGVSSILIIGLLSALPWVYCVYGAIKNAEGQKMYYLLLIFCPIAFFYALMAIPLLLFSVGIIRPW